MILLGISTCDTCRKARKALEDAGHTVDQRDIRTTPLTADERGRLIDRFGDSVVNRRSTTWRTLSDIERKRKPDELLADHPTLLKRPVCIDGDRMTIGWDASARSVWIA